MENFSSRPHINGKNSIYAGVERPDNSHLLTREGITVEQLIAGALLDIRSISPFLYACFCVVPKVETNEVERISVSPGVIYYHAGYLLGVTRAELVFYLIHAMYHIIMRHHIRGIGKDPKKWNEACDLFINKCISDTFKIHPGKEAEEVLGFDGKKVLVHMPENTPYEKYIYTEDDTPEKLYLEMAQGEKKKEDPHETEMKQDEDREGAKGVGGREGAGDEGSNGEQDTGRRESDKDSDTTESDQDATGKKESNKTNFDKNSANKSKENSDGAQGDESKGGIDKDLQEDGTQSPSKEAKNQGQAEKPTNVDEKLDGGNSYEYNYDMVDDESHGKSASELSDDSNRLLSKIKSLYDEQQKNRTGANNAAEDMIGVQFIKTRPALNWRNLIQTRLLNIETGEKALSHPDRRFAYKGLYVEGPIEEEALLSDVKICIDTSASISDEEYTQVMLEVRNLLENFKVTADAVFWDEEIQVMGSFSDLTDLKRLARTAKGRGGTNPECLFREFGRHNSRGYASVMPRLMIIFTDGRFPRPRNIYKTAFDRVVIWVLCSDLALEEKEFDPGFGKVTSLRSREK